MVTQLQIESKALGGGAYSPVLSGILQRKCATCGNHTVAGGECEECKKNPLGLQTKLIVSEPGDRYEQEADRIADEVMAMPVHSAIGKSPLNIQRFSGVERRQVGEVPESVNHVLASSGKPLEPGLRQDMESRFGYDFSHVKVHTDNAAEKSAHDVNAQAYTVGSSIVFGEGRFKPETQVGRRLLTHELTHVVQQNLLGLQPSNSYVQRQEKKNPLDDKAKAIIAKAKDDKVNKDKRAILLVKDIVNTYYAADATKVEGVEFDVAKAGDGLMTESVGSGKSAKGKIYVGNTFVENVDAFARRVLQVGHELLHIDQYRGGLAGGQNKNKREFLAHAQQALTAELPGTGRISYATRRDMIDAALGYLYCLSSEEQESFAGEKEKLLKRREEVNGKAGNAPTSPPTTCKKA